MKKNIAKIAEKYDELREMIIDSYEDIECEPPTPLDRRILNQYQEIWQDILKICKEDNITSMTEFDNKYQNLEFGLEEFLEDFLDAISYNLEYDLKFFDTETKLISEVMEQFKLNENLKQEYELLLIRDRYLIGKEKEAEKQLKTWIKEHPTVGEGYEVQCDWEMEKENPDMEKVAEILEEADNNGTFVDSSYIYGEVIKYAQQIGNDEMAQYFLSLLDFKNQQDFLDFDEDMIFKQEKEELANAMKKLANDKVEKNKKYEQYIKEKDGENIAFLLGPHSVFKPQEELLDIYNDVKKYLLENYKQVIEENIVYMSEEIIELLKNIPTDGLIEIDLQSGGCMHELLDMQRLFFLIQMGMAFSEYDDTKIKIHIPLIKEIQDCLKNEDIQKRNKDFNEKTKIIQGFCEVHGAIHIIDVYEFFNKNYNNIDKDEFIRFIILVCGVLGKSEIKMNDKTGELEYIYQYFIDEKSAKDIIKKNKEINYLTKEEYIKYGVEDFLKTTKGYKSLEEQLSSQMFLGDEFFELLSNILIPYTIEKRLGNKAAEEMINTLVEQINEYQQILPIFDIDANEVKKAFEDIANELPKWK